MIRPARLIQLLGLWALAFLALLTFTMQEDGDPVSRAVLDMTWGLVLLWVVLCGGLVLIFRRRWIERIRRIPLDWHARFVLVAVALALIEEAITVSMTNLAPVFGVPVGAAYITASADYLDVVLFHSVIVFVPMFIGWAWLLSHWDFSPPAVALLFGVSGTLAETISFGPNSLINIGMWSYVYGLMIYLPASTIPRERVARKPRLIHIPLTILFPILCAIPVAIVVGILHPVGIHF